MTYATRLVLCAAALAAGPALASADISAESAFRRFVASREAIRTGEYECTGAKVQETPGSPKVAEKFALRVWFDHDLGATRFDYAEPPRSKGEGKPIGPLGPIEAGSKHVQLKDKTIQWLTGEVGVLIRPVDSRPSHLDPFDARLVGVNGYTDYFRPLTQFDSVVKTFSGLLAEAPVAVSRPAAGTVRLEWPFGQDTRRDDYDEVRGYLPIRREIVQKSAAGGVAKVVRWSETTWVQVDGFWVPEKSVAGSGERGKSESRYEMKFAWRSVNRPIPPETFTVRGLGIPDKTLIGDARAGGVRSIRLGSVGDMTPDPRLASLDPVLDPPWWRGWRGVAAAVGGVAVGAVGLVVVLLGWSRLRRGRAGDGAG